MIHVTTRESRGKEVRKGHAAPVNSSIFIQNNKFLFKTRPGWQKKRVCLKSEKNYGTREIIKESNKYSGTDKVIYIADVKWS